ncbi:MAG: S8 family serine peptidase [Candidatus Sumerlaeia bacterium]
MLFILVIPLVPAQQTGEKLRGNVPQGVEDSGALRMPTKSVKYHPNIIIVGFSGRASAAARNDLHTRQGARLAHRYRYISADVVRLPESISPEAAIKSYRGEALVEYAEPNYFIEHHGKPNDADFAKQWNLHNATAPDPLDRADINALAAWQKTTGSSDVVVAVCDTGIDYNHPDLAGNLWVNVAEQNGSEGVDDDGNGIVDDIHGAAWTSGDGSVTDTDILDNAGHGSHVAGIIGATGNDHFGVSGVNWDVSIMALKFMAWSGGYTADAIAAIEYSMDKNVKIVNHSWGQYDASQALEDAFAASNAAGQLSVISAGNSDLDIDSWPNYPAAYNHAGIISVAAGNVSDQRWGNSNFGRAGVDLAAPGESVYSTYAAGFYEYMNGTSMAAPHVSGVAALILSRQPTATAAQMKDWILRSGRPRAAWDGYTLTGRRLDADGALRLASASTEVQSPANFLAQYETGTGNVNLNWNNPAGASFQKCVIRRDTDDYPGDPFSGEAVYSGTGDSTSDTGLAAGNTYYYSIFADFGDGIYSPAATAVVETAQSPTDFFTEYFTSEDNDLDNFSVTFVPDSSANGYQAYGESITEFPCMTDSGTRILDQLNGSQVVILQDGKTFPFFGEEQTAFFVVASGSICFGQPKVDYTLSLQDHFAVPQIAMLFENYHTYRYGDVRYIQYDDRVAVSFKDMPIYGTDKLNTFQAELFFDGRIRLSWLDIQTTDGIVGLSRGKGLPTGFFESDFTAYGPIDDMTLSNGDSLVASGDLGGPFSPASQSWQVQNAGASSFNWTASATVDWVDLSNTGGSLGGGANTTVQATINANANSLMRGMHYGEVVFTNTNTGFSRTRKILLKVIEDGFYALYLVDGLKGPDSTMMALENRGYAVDRITDWDDFPGLFGVNDYDLVVVLYHGGWQFDIDLTTLQNYVAGGGKFLMYSWDVFPEHYAFMQCEYSGFWNLDNVTLTEAALADRIGAEQPVSNPGWGVFNHGLLGNNLETDALASWPNGDDAIVVGNDGKTIMLGFCMDSLSADAGLGFFENLLAWWEGADVSFGLTPYSGFEIDGPEGGAFTPASKVFTLTNESASAISWSAASNADWLGLSPANGNLTAGASVDVTATINSNANSLAPGEHEAVLTFADTGSGKYRRRDCTLTVMPAPGEINVTDSVPAADDLAIDFGTVRVGQSQTEQVTISNTHGSNDLVLSDIYVVGQTGHPDPAPALSIPAKSPLTMAERLAPPHAPDMVIVRFADNAGQSVRAAAHSRVGGTVVHRFGRIPAEVVQLEAGASLAQAVRAYESLPGVAYAEPNYRVQLHGMPDDPAFGTLWGMHNTGQNNAIADTDINAPEAWNLATGSDEVIVAIIDSGIDYTHEDLAANMWTNEAEANGTEGVDDDGNGIVDDIHGASWVYAIGEPTSGDPMDLHGHGTHTGGTVGAVGNNGVGIAGVCWNVRLMAVQVINQAGSGYSADIVAGIEYAIDQGAHISNNSYGTSFRSAIIEEAVAHAGAAGMLFVASAGNNSYDIDVIPAYPACFDGGHIISVGSIEPDNTLSDFSNWGLQNVDIAAPGRDIISCRTGGGYTSNYGTSMAAPHVAGAAALIKSARPDATALQIRQWIMDNTRSVPAWSGKSVSGGRLDAEAALIAAHKQARIENLPAMPSVLGPGQSLALDVTFEPLQAGDYDMELRIESNDTDEGTVAVSLTGSSPADAMSVSPDSPLMASGPTGGPFDPASQAYRLGNSGSSALNWSVSADATWLRFTPSSGSIPAGGEVSVSAIIAPQAGSLAGGLHEATITFSNGTTGQAFERPFELMVHGEYFTELFDADDGDLEGLSLILTPDASPDSYSGRIEGIADFPSDPSGGNSLTMLDDSSVMVTLSGGKTVSLYGQTYDRFFVSANGYISFDRTDSASLGDLASHFNLPRISAWFDDLAPHQAGTVSWKQTADCVAVTWDGVPEVDAGNSHRVQVEMFFDGGIRISWLQLDSSEGLAGISAGNGIPSGFVESDLSELQTKDVLSVTPGPDVIAESSGYAGGPFSSPNLSWTLGNNGSDTVDWTLSSDVDWLDPGLSGGSLTGGETIPVSASLNANANALAAGAYDATLNFTNTISGITQQRFLRLTVMADPGNIAVTDSIAPDSDRSMNFGNIDVGQSRTEQITINNTDGSKDLRIDNISLRPQSHIAQRADLSMEFPEARQRSMDEILRGEYDASTIIVGFRGKADRATRDAIHRQAGTRLAHTYKYIPADVVHLDGRLSLKATIAAYLQNPSVAYAEPNYILHAGATPDDSRFDELWGLDNTGQTGGATGADIQAKDAWDISTGSSDIIVAVIDSGVEYSHRDLRDNMWVNTAEESGIPGFDDDGNGIVDDIYGARWENGDGSPSDGDPDDDYGHGTHCAGTLGATGDNNRGVTGVAWNVRIMSLRFINEWNSGFTTDAISCIEYAIEKGAHLSSNSWGGGAYSESLKQAILASGQANMLFINSASNLGTDNDESPIYPPAFDCSNMIVVASSDHNDMRSVFSCYGATSVDIAAPGTDILSTYPDNSYETLSGTSMACPHVSGVAALILSLNPEASYSQVKDWILDSATPLPQWQGLVLTGGRLNAYEALRMARPHFYLTGLPNMPHTLAAGDSLSVNVVCEPIEAITHNYLTRIESNDRDESRVDIELSARGIGDALQLSPDEPFSTILPKEGGSFQPQSKVYTLTNTGDSAINWSASKTGNWLSLSDTGGSLAAGASVEVTVNLTAQADNLDAGGHSGEIVFTNTSSGASTTINASAVVEIDFFVEEFSHDLDLTWKSLTFTPAGSKSEYTAVMRKAEEFFTSTENATDLDINTNRNKKVTLSGGKKVSFYGTEYSEFYVGSNGYITFGSGDNTYWSSLENHYKKKRIAPMFYYFYTTNAAILFEQLDDRAVVTWKDVYADLDGENLNNFQLELFWDGRIRMTWLDMTNTRGICGFSKGGGIPALYSESDMTDYFVEDAMSVGPEANFVANGLDGGPFAPSHQIYVISNKGSDSLSWSVSTDVDWLNFSPASGSLTAGESVNVNVQPNSQATLLASGVHTGHITFENTDTGYDEARLAKLVVQGSDKACLYYADNCLGDNHLLTALQNQGYTVTEAASWTDFNSQLDPAAYPLAVALNQADSNELDLEVAADYMARNGRMIVNDWRRNSAQGALFGASYTGNMNLTPLTPGSLINSGLGGSVVLEGRGYRTWGVGMEPTSEGQTIASFANGEAAVIFGNERRSVLLGFTVDAPNTTDGPKLFENILTLFGQSVPSLVVNIEPQAARDRAAKWSIDDGTTWYASGTELARPLADYTVRFSAVSGWISPEPISLTGLDASNPVVGTYTRLTDPSLVRDYLLGKSSDRTGLDINADGKIDAADLIELIRN